MPARSFEELAERLLRAGIAPRQVRRYLVELREHWQDAVSAEFAKGASRAQAEEAASVRLGTDDDLAQSLLAQPALRSAAARFPALFFGIGPAFVWLGALAATLCTVHLLYLSSAPTHHSGPSWAIGAVYTICVLYLRVLPVALGAGVLASSWQHGVRLPWPVAGTVLLQVLAGTVSIQLFPAAPGQADQLGVGSVLLPFLLPQVPQLGRPDLLALQEGLARALGMLAVSAALYLLRRRQQRSSLSRP